MLTKQDYKIAAEQLKVLHTQLTQLLRHQKEIAYKDMKKVCPGLWIHNQYNNLSDCLKWLNSILPQDTLNHSNIISQSP